MLHLGTLDYGTIKKDAECKVTPDYERRAMIAKNHSATHMLNWALRRVLGGKIDQRGSLVTGDRLRFDFTYTKPVELEDMRKVEDLVNQEVARKNKTFYEDVPLAKAEKINGLRAVFGEKYPDPVRVVSMGVDIPTLTTDLGTNHGEKFSIEFCGGTHITCSSELFKLNIVMEEGIAKGIRRMTCITGPSAVSASALRMKQLGSDMDAMGSLDGKQLDAMVSTMRQRISETADLPLVQKRDALLKVDDIKKKLVAADKGRVQALLKEAKETAAKLAADNKDKPVVVHKFDEIEGDAKLLSQLGEVCQKGAPNTSWFLIAPGGGKMAVLVISSDKENVPANKWMDAGLATCGGRGGGKPDRAQGQSQDASKADACYDAAVKFAKECGKL